MVSVQADPSRLASIFVDEPLVGLPLQVGEGASASGDAQEGDATVQALIRSTEGLAVTPAETAALGCERLAARGPVTRLYSIAAGIVEQTIHAVLWAACCCRRTRRN